jgi:hypothetical protein
MAMIRRIFTYKFFPLSWTILIVILLCLPGTMVPGTGLFAIRNFDKIVHIILFGLNVLFWGWHFETNERTNRLRFLFFGTTLLTILLGITLEYVQLYFIPNRSFDVGDIVADGVGSVLAGIWLLKG